MPVLIFMIFISTFCSSTNDPKYMDSGQITGFDMRECICCGGFFINIQNETYRSYNLPQNSKFQITTETEFPISVRLNWTESEILCLGDEIDILNIEKLD